MIIILFLVFLVWLWFYFLIRFIKSTKRIHELRERQALEEEIMRSAYYGFDSPSNERWNDDFYLDDEEDTNL